ncbi:hypothetical protein BDR03DRAFT_977728 [Suillus americanus]|nr:hypothetical protein BDR03DRAFT_977728 [Suillus americanus]
MDDTANDDPPFGGVGLNSAFVLKGRVNSPTSYGASKMEQSPDLPVASSQTSTQHGARWASLPPGSTSSSCTPDWPTTEIENTRHVQDQSELATSPQMTQDTMDDDSNKDSGDNDNNLSDRSNILGKDEWDMDSIDNPKSNNKHHNDSTSLDHRMQLKPTSSRLHSADSLKHFKFKTCAVIGVARPPAPSAQSKSQGTTSLPLAKKSGTIAAKSKKVSICGAHDDITDDYDTDGEGSTCTHMKKQDIVDQLEQAQKLWECCFMDHPHTLKKKNEPVFFLVKQCTYNWHSMFTTHGKKAVTAFIAQQSTDFDTPTEIMAYIEWAVPNAQSFEDEEGKGRAPPLIFPFIWYDVDESDAQNPIRKGLFQHEAIFNTFAFYLESVSAIPEGVKKTSLPSAALALATVTFSYYISPKATLWGLPTQEVMVSIDKLKPHTWMKILEGAARFVRAHKPKSVLAQSLYTAGGGTSGRAMCYESESDG